MIVRGWGFVQSYLLPKFLSLFPIRHNITQRLIQMKQDPEVNREFFSTTSPYYQLDSQRLNYYKTESGAQKEQKSQDKIKKVINPIIFREEVRRRQRDFRQGNHQFLKMAGIISRSSRDETKFGLIGDYNRKTNNYAQGNANSKNAQKRSPLIHLSLDTTQFSCSLLNDKVPMKEVYQLFPFRKQSIIFQSNQYLSSNYIFFIYQNQNQVAENIKAKLQSTIEEGILSQFKNSINKNFKHVGFFDYLYFVNKRSARNQKQVNYPSYIHQIARSNPYFLQRIDEEEKSNFNHDQICVNEQDTCDRVIVCEEDDIVDNGENLCFETIQEYTDYKKYMTINFKMQKIFQKDAIINTNIRNIISTEKIYLVEIIQQVKSYIQLSQECDGSDIMKKVYEQITSKADQYLRLLCGYTESKILTKYNIQNYQQKIYSFIEKSIRFNKQIRNLPKAVIKQFPVLEIWYDLPENLLGYTREELHNTFYDLMEAIIVFQDKIRYTQFYQSLKIKRLGVHYLK